MNVLNTSKKIDLALKEQGRNKAWLATQLGISRPTLYQRLKDNFWSTGDIIKLQSLGVL